MCEQGSRLHFAILGQPHDAALPLCEWSRAAAAEEKLELLPLMLDCCWLPREEEGEPYSPINAAIMHNWRQQKQ